MIRATTTASGTRRVRRGYRLGRTGSVMSSDDRGIDESGMTPDEIRILDALVGCSFLPGSGQKRFVRQMHSRERSRALSDRQRDYLWAIAWSWRRQLPADLVALARRYSGGVGIRGRWINEARAVA